MPKKSCYKKRESYLEGIPASLEVLFDHIIELTTARTVSRHCFYLTCWNSQPRGNEFAGYDLLISHYVSKVFLLLLFHGFQATTSASENIFWPRQGNQSCHAWLKFSGIAVQNLPLFIQIIFCLPSRTFLLIEEVGKKPNLASATLWLWGLVEDYGK